MSRRKKRPQQAPRQAVPPERVNAEPKKSPWYKRFWVITSGICAILFAILINGPDALRNSRVLPYEVSKTLSKFRSWIKEDSDWTGKWTAHPEGFADLADMQLSDVDLEVAIWATEGYIDGTIATKRICKEFPMNNYILLEGSVFGDSAKVTAWDLVGGHRVEFARLTLKRDGYLMTVTPTDGNKEWFPATSRIARDPSAPEDKKKLDADHTFCAMEKAEFFNSLREPK